ncbi:MAG: S9 family peptidase [Candidatus Protochlamydia sp.]|nr:S9 family peptidase [Candidatus Protochlamydia sp.]
MTYDDIIRIAKPMHVQISPDGKQLAYVTRRGDFDKNRNIDTLYIGSIDSEVFKESLVIDEIAQLIWNQDSARLFVLSKEEGIYRIRCTGDNGFDILIEEHDPIKRFTFSEDGSLIYYTLTKFTPNEIIEKNKAEGYVYNWGIDTPSLIMNKYKIPDHEEIWSFSVQLHTKQWLMSIPNGNWHYDEFYLPLIESLELSENGKYLLLQVNRYGDNSSGDVGFSSDIAVWDIVKENWKLPLTPAPRKRYCPRWVRNDQFVYSIYSCKDQLGGLFVFDLATMQEKKLTCISDISWDECYFWDKQNAILYRTKNRALYRIDIKNDKIEKLDDDAYIEKASFNQTCSHFAYVSQSSNLPPDIYLYSTSTKDTRRLTKLNPQLDEIAHGYVEAINERTSNDLPIRGYLVHPVNQKPHVRYPIIIATYGFHGDFIADAEWHSSFPAQPLAAEGYMILLLNLPGSGQTIIGDYKKAQEEAGWSLLPIFEESLDLLAKKGGDTEKVGVYGWSHGAFVVSFLITHSTKFHVAALGEGGSYSPFGFFEGGMPHVTQTYTNLFGGPPWGATLKNYIPYSPFFHIDKIKTPLLTELAHHIGTSGGEFELYVPLRYLGVPAELVYYDNEEHIFVQPKARLASMARKADWFNYWLLDKKDQNPSKKEQYDRWDLMKIQQTVKNST